MADHLKSKRHSKTKPNRPFKIRTSSEFEPLLYLGNYLKTGLTKACKLNSLWTVVNHSIFVLLTTKDFWHERLQVYLINYLKTGLTKGSVDENLKWISMPKIVTKKAQNSSDLFLPFHLHFCTVTEIIKQ